MPERGKAWTRKTALGGAGQPGATELWECVEGEETVASFEVDVTIGKPLDVLALKGASLDEIREYAGFLRATAKKLYAGQGNTRDVSECPCCGARTASAVEAATIFGVSYKRCSGCGHAFVGAQPTPEVLRGVFAESEEHSAIYTDKARLDFRLAQIIRPKLDWVMRTYRRRHGRDPRTLLDVGAGGGHFLQVCRQVGLEADGYELSKASRRFAKEMFDIDLRSGDFLSAGEGLGRFDVVTFWGLLEYTPEPRRYLEAARSRLETIGAMLVVEVPRFDCLGTAIQKECPETVARHLDPTSHVNCFSDASLATALFTTGFRPVAAWYFGMDAYELLVQLALRLENPGAIEGLGDLIPGLQACLDAARLCDDVVVAAVPLH